MPARFHWHPDARAFAGHAEVCPTQGPALNHIAAEPPATALEGLFNTLGHEAAFCVSNIAPPDLAPLAPHLFTTLTGGASGTPKIILRTQSSWITSFETNATHFAYTPDDSIAVLGALSHSLALYGVLEGLHLGLNVHALSPLAPSAQCDALHRNICTILYATPTQLRLLPKGKTLPHIRLILCGGGALSSATRDHILTQCPNATLHVFYGAAETSFITLSDSSTPDSSVGQPYPQVKITVRNPDDTGTGEIWVRSPYLFEQYLRGTSEHTRSEEGWLTLGEIGRLDSDGYLHLRGRAGRVFNIADQTIYPEELETRLLSCEGMTQCTVMARPDALRGHHLIIAAAGPDDDNRRAALLAYCKTNNIILPREIIFLDPFPNLPSGKPDLTRIAALTGCTP